jgi:hypothetical protein
VGVAHIWVASRLRLLRFDAPGRAQWIIPRCARLGWRCLMFRVVVYVSETRPEWEKLTEPTDFVTASAFVRHMRGQERCCELFSNNKQLDAQAAELAHYFPHVIYSFTAHEDCKGK